MWVRIPPRVLFNVFGKESIYTTSVNENTLGEAPMAYKSLEDIIGVIKESVDIIDVMKPIYNYKASD